MVTKPLPCMDAHQLNRKKLYFLTVLVMFAGYLFAPVFAVAQDTPEALAVNTVVSATIENLGDSRSWTLEVTRDSVLSFLVTGEADFDPVLTIRDSSGEVLIMNDDYAYPDTMDSLLEAITFPSSGTYEIVVSGFDDSTGDFTLIVLPGYADVHLDERFDDDAWSVELPGELSYVDESAVLTIEGVQERAIAVDDSLVPLADFYAQVVIDNIESRNNWTTGLMLRGQSNGDGYLLLVDALGQWRFTALEDGSERVVRDWNIHPAIIPGQTTFTLSVLANGRSFDVFYNNLFIGRAVDGAITESGTIGAVAMTANALNSLTSTSFSSLTVTTPYTSDTGATIFPERLIGGTPSQVTSELERRRIIPAGGSQALTVSESFVESVNPGVSRQVLGRGSTYSTFVIGTRTRLQSITGDGIAGCGLLLFSGEDTNYAVAYVDSSGAHGVSMRVGDAFSDGIFADAAGVSLADGQPRDLLVIVTGDMLHYFIDNVHRGSMSLDDDLSGEIGNVIVNFDPVDASCRFDNTWVWQWSE